MKRNLKFSRRKNSDLKINFDNISSVSIKNFFMKSSNDKQDNAFFITPQNKDSKTLIKVSNLEKWFGTVKNKHYALKNISFEIKEGECLSFLGGNGAGKTTLVEILSGLNKPSKGNIEYLFDYDKSYLEKIGIQFQDSSFPPALSVKEIVEFMITVFDIKINNDDFYALLKIFGIDEFYKKNAHSLSGGQQQRLNAILAIIHKPKIVFLDEISTGLDINIKTRIKEFIKSYAKEYGMTIILVSHDLDEIKYLCDRMIILEKGEIKSSFYINEIKDKTLDEFVKPYIK
ncbi:MAG: ABC transporter ATP-binding protein [Metamycoplasmataceae bacterium]